MYLIELKKKKKEPNSLEGSEFAGAWSMFVKEEGFSERAEGFLYNGLIFCRAKPFREYMKKCANQLETLNELYSGKLYGDTINFVYTRTFVYNMHVYIDWRKFYGREPKH